MKNILLLLALLTLSSTLTFGQSATPNAPSEKKMAEHDMAQTGFYSPGEIKWQKGPAALPAGAKAAVLEGDPTKEGPFVMRLWLPDGFSVQPHWHPKVERITVISGTFNLGMGEKFDKSAGREMTAGSFGFWPPEMRHFAWVKGDTILQLHGIGPWTINYVNARDDPRNKKP
ncbi:MAG: cupin domain-containing protein [Pyrinomonadaceae bacterium]